MNERIKHRPPINPERIEELRKIVEKAEKFGTLILTRSPGQTIVIDSGNATVLIRVLGVEKNRIKLGISGPMNVLILRGEFLNQNPTDQKKNYEQGK